MTIEDANYLLGIAEANFSYAFKNMDHDQKVTLVKTWAFGLQDIPADIVMLAFMQLTTTSKWLPTVAEIREQIRDLYCKAREKLDDVEDARRLYRMVGGEQPKEENPKSIDLCRYIVSNTEHLSTKAGPGLKLNKILNMTGGYLTAIGSGQMGFAEIEQ